MKITDWSDSVIFARVLADISDLPDIAKVELTVQPKEKPVIVWKRHGFRAARADIAVPSDWPFVTRVDRSLLMLFTNAHIVVRCIIFDHVRAGRRHLFG